jgi:hypothetical protein
MTPEKTRLLELEETGNFLFHGTESADEVSVFEPRQAHNFVDGEHHPDGPPAIFASSIAEYAIFRAIVNARNCPDRPKSGVSVKTNILIGPTLTYWIAPATLAQVRDDAYGFVYVFDKKDFKRKDRGSVEYISLTSVKPVEKIRVTKADLPENIKLI